MKQQTLRNTTTIVWDSSLVPLLMYPPGNFYTSAPMLTRTKVLTIWVRPCVSPSASSVGKTRDRELPTSVADSRQPQLTPTVKPGNGISASVTDDGASGIATRNARCSPPAVHWCDAGAQPFSEERQIWSVSFSLSINASLTIQSVLALMGNRKPNKRN